MTWPLPYRRVSACIRARDRTACWSWTDSHQIDDREQRDPDDVERVPEEGKTKETPLDRGTKALNGDLGHHHSEPDQTAGDMEAVAADEREERRQKCVALRSCPNGDHA